MEQQTPTTDSLVLYKTRAAIIRAAGDKLEIELEDGKTHKVRPKDVGLLHLGPVHSFNELCAPDGEVEEAWELLAGQTTALDEVAELIYGTFTPATAWSAWQLVADGLYFRGTPDQVVARSAEEVAAERAAREAKAAEKRAWAEFALRLRSHRVEPQDKPYLDEIVDVALGRTGKSRALHELGRRPTPENAHALLLELGRWDDAVNPYPERLGVSLTPPAGELPELPDEDRTDLTHLPAFAIDDEGNQDPDDAVSLDGSRIWVHVADVAAVILPDSAADIDARGRGATLYSPEQTTPMLPHAAVQQLGLGLAEVSPALSFGLDVSDDGEIGRVEVTPSWVRVQRLTYEEAEGRLGEEPFAALRRLTKAFEARRRAKGAVFMELPDVQIKVVDGDVRIRPLPPLDSRSLVSEVMLMAGQGAARFALEHDIAFPFTTQNPPEPTELPDGLAGMYARRRSLKRSQQQSTPGPHAGLGLEAYAQATSPLRRYLDLVVHQQLRAHLSGGAPMGSQQMLERVGAAQAVSGRVRQAERLARKHWTLVYLKAHPDWRGDAVVVDKRGKQAALLVPELDLETRMLLQKDLPLNTVLRVSVKGIALPELMAHLSIVE